MIAMRLEWEDGGDHLPGYDDVASLLRIRARPPAGMLVHTAGVTEGGGFRVFDVWETREHVEAFYEDFLMPAARVLTGTTPPPPTTTEVYELHDLIRP